MSVIQFRLAARTDAAGKYNPNAPLEGNEDNMFVDSDLARGKLGEFNADEVVNLSEKGCLMVVADGMGGMNAGEVASDIAIKTVMEYFTPERLTDSIIRDSGSRMRYMETVVVAADEAIKKDSTSNPEHEGMGSTIIMAWLFNDEICLTWCGDSRAYLFRPGQGFKQVSKDHSYVQGLVDEGKITEVEAFDHPYGNVIMRSLGDPEKKAEPESRCFKVNQGDIFMLCSDGLSGVLRDRKTYNANGERIDTDNLEDIIAAHRDSMAECRDCLFEAARRNDWYDNVTAILCEIVKTDAASSAPSSPNAYSIGSSTVNSTHRKKYLLYVFVALIAFGLGLFLALRLLQSDPSPKEEIAATVEENDSTSTEVITNLDTTIEPDSGLNTTAPNTTPTTPTTSSATKTPTKTTAPNTTPTTPTTPSPTTTTPTTTAPNTTPTTPTTPSPTTTTPTTTAPNTTPTTPTTPSPTTTTPTTTAPNTTPTTPTTPSSTTTTPTTNQNGLSVSSNQELGRETGDNANATAAPKQDLSEEEMLNSINTIEDCCRYIEKFGDRTKHYSDVKLTFKSLYKQKFDSSKETVVDLEKFLDEHGNIMKRMKLVGSKDIDKYYHNKATDEIQKKKNE